MRSLVRFALLFGFSTLPALAQAGSQDPSDFLPRYSVALGYNNIRANAPPATCGCFDMNGGFASGTYALKYWLNAAAEVTGGQAKNIGPLGQDLTLTTYTAGPQVVFRWTHFTPYAQALFGAAHGSDSYFPSGNTFSTGATSFAFTTGGGVDYHLNHRLAIRLVEAQYLHTTLPNGTNNQQNHLMLGAGVVFKFRGHYAQPTESHQRPEPVAPPAPPSPPTPPPPPAPPALPELSPSPAPEPVAPTSTTPAPVTPTEFHQGIRDIFFDYDSATLRPDTRQGVADAVAFLNAHPALRIQVGGYSDERGTIAYNFALSRRRAETARDALLAAGISANRVRAVSYGKSVEVCKEKDEACWQRNRRAAFLPEP